MKFTKHILLTALCAASLLVSLASCGKAEACPVCGATYLCDCAVVETKLTQAPCPVCGSTEICDCTLTVLATGETTTSMIYDNPPTVGLSFTCNMGGMSVVQATSLDTANFSWTYHLSPDTAYTRHCDGLRPCDSENTASLPLDKMADDYVVTLGLCEEIIESYTVKAYPIGKVDAAHATDCPVTNGKLAVLKGAYYYELIIHYTQGSAVYGFFIQ